MQSLINILRNERNKPIYHQTIYYAIFIHHAGWSSCMNHVTSGCPGIGLPVDSAWTYYLVAVNHFSAITL